VGVDAVTKAMDAAALEANRHALSARLKRMGYRPHPKRRISMPKPGRETERLLGSSRCEDQSVARATQRGRDPLLAPLVAEGSAGYRPQRRPPQGLDALGRTLQPKRVNLLVEADLRGFLDHTS
jgi:RNA-directed DNA polymerase